MDSIKDLKFDIIISKHAYYGKYKGYAEKLKLYIVYTITFLRKKCSISKLK
jgi:hypothetical protein